MSNRNLFMMNWTRVLVAAAMFMAVCSAPCPAQAANFTILTEELPPYNYTDEGKVTGAAAEVVREVLRRVGHPDTIEVRSWSIAYNLAKTRDNHVVFSTTRTEEREKLFKWVGPIVEDKMVFFARKGSGIIVNSLDDARKAGKIGTYRDDVGETFLKGKDFTNTESTLVSGQNVRKLAAGRVDLWVENLAVGLVTARRSGVADKIEPVFTINKQMMYMAFSHDTPDSVIRKWQETLDNMKADGSYKTILQRFGMAE
ncbi:MAG: transporter substrate-binding domain-containing protein [Nitrospirota bacterium]|nr:transporter substrate-binding domain-containing protein [Nitrospirota bacterium]